MLFGFYLRALAAISNERIAFLLNAWWLFAYAQD